MTTTERKITDHAIDDHGIDGAQYFPGASNVFTDWTGLAVGRGDNFAEAIEDAMEDLAQQGWDTDGMEARILADEGWDALPTMPSAHDDCSTDDHECDDGCELGYYVVLRVR